jgi:hypothetical protein
MQPFSREGTARTVPAPDPDLPSTPTGTASGGPDPVPQTALAAGGPWFSTRTVDAVMAAAQAGQWAEVEVYLDAGFPWTTRGPRGVTLLHIAARRGHAPLVARALDAGAPTELRCSVGRTPLWYAAQAGCAPVLAVLLGAGADANARDEGSCTTPLMALVTFNDLGAHCARPSITPGRDDSGCSCRAGGSGYGSVASAAATTTAAIAGVRYRGSESQDHPRCCPDRASALDGLLTLLAHPATDLTATRTRDPSTSSSTGDLATAEGIARQLWGQEALAATIIAAEVCVFSLPGKAGMPPWRDFCGCRFVRVGAGS